MQFFLDNFCIFCTKKLIIKTVKKESSFLNFVNYRTGKLADPAVGSFGGKLQKGNYSGWLLVLRLDLPASGEGYLQIYIYICIASRGEGVWGVRANDPRLTSLPHSFILLILYPLKEYNNPSSLTFTDVFSIFLVVLQTFPLWLFTSRNAYLSSFSLFLFAGGP